MGESQSHEAAWRRQRTEKCSPSLAAPAQQRLCSAHIGGQAGLFGRWFASSAVGNSHFLSVRGKELACPKGREAGKVCSSVFYSHNLKSDNLKQHLASDGTVG